MKPKLTIVVGMGGSGKSNLCDKRKGEFTRPNKALLVFDEPTVPSEENERRAGFGGIAEVVAQLIVKDADCLIADSHFTCGTFRELFVDFCNNFLRAADVRWVFFQADALACMNNVYDDWKNGKSLERTGGRIDALFDQIAAYHVPTEQEFPGRQIETVDDCTRRHFSDEQTARDALAHVRSKFPKR